MEILIFIVITLLLVGIGTAVLGAALLFVGGEEINRDTLLKCLGIVVVATLVAFIPIFGYMSPVVWFAGVMAVFEKTFLEALLITFGSWIIAFGAVFGLGLLANLLVSMFA